MWNPFKAIGNAIAKTTSAIARTVSAPFRREKAPSAPARTPIRVERQPTPRPERTMSTWVPMGPPAPPPAQPTHEMQAVKPKKLPPSMITGRRTGGGAITEERTQIEDAIDTLFEAVREFESDNSLIGLNQKAMDFLASPSYSAIFDQYVSGSGFPTEQWIDGMSNVDNFRITRVKDQIQIIFDADFEMGGDYDLGGRSPYATF